MSVFDGGQPVIQRTHRPYARRNHKPSQELWCGATCALLDVFPVWCKDAGRYGGLADAYANGRGAVVHANTRPVGLTALAGICRR